MSSPMLKKKSWNLELSKCTRTTDLQEWKLGLVHRNLFFLILIICCFHVEHEYKLTQQFDTETM